jgi:hypothetical protein
LRRGDIWLLRLLARHGGPIMDQNLGPYDSVKRHDLNLCRAHAVGEKQRRDCRESLLGLAGRN